MTPFVVFDLSGADAQKFLQGQLTCDVTKLTATYQATAISNLKGRVAFGLWINKTAASDYQLVISEDCANDFAQHIKKYAAFSKSDLIGTARGVTRDCRGCTKFCGNQR